MSDTIQGNEDAVSEALEAIRGENYASQFYNNEQALRAIIKYAYISAFGQYVMVEEMPSGKGIADIAFIPKRLSRLPAMLVELKWNKTSGGAIAQIKEKRVCRQLETLCRKHSFGRDKLQREDGETFLLD